MRIGKIERRAWVGKFVRIGALSIFVAGLTNTPRRARRSGCGGVKALLASAARLAVPVDLSGRDLAGLDLAGVDFKSANLRGRC